MTHEINPLNPNPVQQASSFAPPPTGVVTVAGMAKETLAYWKTVRLAWLSGYKINWVIPGREGAVSGSRSVWNLDVRIQPVEEIFPARTARYTIEPYVLLAGRPHIEPELGTRVTVKAEARKGSPQLRSEGINLTGAPSGLGETARWLPTPDTYVGGFWSPTGTAPVGQDAAIRWQGSEENLPVIDDEFTYAHHGQWETTTAMSIQASNYFRLNGMSLLTGGNPSAPVTFFFVGAIAVPTLYWGSLLRAVEADGSNPMNVTNLDFRLMPDGNLHPYTWGWQEALPLVGENHTLSLFGFTLDPAAKTLVMFTIDRSFRSATMKLPYPHSTTSQFVLGRTAEALFNIYLLDVMFYRGAMTLDQTEAIASELDASYGITARLSQEQG